MKNAEMIVLALVGVAAFMVYQTVQTKSAVKAPPQQSGQANPGTGSGPAPVTEILNGQNLPFDNGWRYYSDGTSIGPDGSYYFGGQKVWAP
jgi:hypothetical protein